MISNFFGNDHFHRKCFFFARVNQTFNSFQKRTENHFYGNHFWSKGKSFSCVVNHLQLSCKSFFNVVNDFLTAKKSWKWFLAAVNHLLRIISMWKSFEKKPFPFGNLFGKKHFGKENDFTRKFYLSCSRKSFPASIFLKIFVTSISIFIRRFTLVLSRKSQRCLAFFTTAQWGIIASYHLK